MTYRALSTIGLIAICFVLTCILYVFALLNSTGFCYSQMRYVPDEEILLQTLNLDWQDNMRRVSELNPNAKVSELIQYIRNIPTFGRVNGRSMDRQLLFYSDPLIDTPMEILRIFGLYRVVASLSFDSGVGKYRYITWFRSFDQCGQNARATWNSEDDQVDDDRWNGRWRRARVEDDKIIFDLNDSAKFERK